MDFAIASGIPYGGWCPRGGWAEDRRTPPGLLAQYPCLQQTPSEQTDERTLWNVRDSDATLILTQPAARLHSRGSVLTERAAVAFARPLAVVDLLDPTGARAIVEDLLDAMAPAGALNVAGPRESEASGIYDLSWRLLEQLLFDRTDLTERAEIV